MSTRFLRVPSFDWPAVKIGAKTEFRTKPREGSRLITCNTPTPVVAYSLSNGPLRQIVSKLMVLEERKFEPLFALAEDAEGLAREGFESYDHFRRYWRKRNKGRFVPMQRVWVWRVRPWRHAPDEWSRGDEDKMGEALIEELYGEHLL